MCGVHLLCYHQGSQGNVTTNSNAMTKSIQHYAWLCI
ncbi:rCG46048 [Rattus norvegicus]|uniref:RCG46048 n=1 Tax=Rattus norvegicus TaxID=10116 RepID=A6ICF9_RAT|nr:rCG46048 [Rattus norvegicus]